jgi:hypothetical protein
MVADGRLGNPKLVSDVGTREARLQQGSNVIARGSARDDRDVVRAIARLACGASTVWATAAVSQNPTAVISHCAFGEVHPPSDLGDGDTF